MQSDLHIMINAGLNEVSFIVPQTLMSQGEKDTTYFFSGIVKFHKVLLTWN